MDVKIFTGRTIFTMGDDYHEVELFYKSKKLKKGFGYVKGDLVYIYRGKLDKADKYPLPGIYKDRLGDIVFIEPEKNDRHLYSIEKIIELDIDVISNHITEKEDNFIDPEDIEIINNNSEVWIPEIKEGDDFLKKIVKQVIKDKDANLRNYRGKFSNQYALNNMKSGLNKDTKMTVTNFKIWEEVLGFKWKMVIEDDGTDKVKPLKRSLEYTSDEF